jgi:hypothetical protein
MNVEGTIMMRNEMVLDGNKIEMVNNTVNMKHGAHQQVMNILGNNEQIVHMMATSNEEVKAMQMASTMGTGFGLTTNFGVHTIVTLTNERLLLSYFDMAGSYIETSSYLYEEVKGITTHTSSYSQLECFYINTTNNKSYLLFAGKAHYAKLFDTLRIIPAAVSLVTATNMETTSKNLTQKDRKWNAIGIVAYVCFAVTMILTTLN